VLPWTYYIFQGLVACTYVEVVLTQVAIVSSDREDDVGEDDAMDEDDEEDIVSITFPNDST
jgi:hypothetical protein